MSNADEKPTAFLLAKRFFKYHWKGLLTTVTPLALLPVMTLNNYEKEYRCMYTILLCCVYWIFDCLPFYVTAMLPILLLPSLNVLDSETTCQNYFKNVMVMFLASIIMALAIEYCNLHKRVALRTILFVGCSPRRLQFGLILVTTFISMWIANSATTAMMCPIVKAVLTELDTNKVIEIYMDEEEEPAVDGKRHPSHIALSFYLCCAYASSIGGVGTLIGSGTNLVFKGLFEARFPDATDKIDFPQFMAWSMPMVIVDSLLLFMTFQITHLGWGRPNSKAYQEVKKGSEIQDIVRAVVQEKYDELGPMSVHEWQVLLSFILMVALLFFRSPGFMTGWANILNAVKIKSATVCYLTVLILFLLPMTCFCCSHFKSKGPYPTVRERPLISWEFIHKNGPWGLIFLLGGGFALADASQKSGMATLLGKALGALETWPVILVQAFSIGMTVILTNFSANVPVCNLVMPILMEMAVAIRIHPMNLVFPVGIACSMAFHLPVGTPPNAIVAAYSGMRTKYMAVAGIIPSIIVTFSLILNTMTMHYVVYPAREFPEWAEAAPA